MSMDWWQLLIGFIGTNGITYYFAKPKKHSIEIENFKKLFDEAQDERQKMKELYDSYEKKTDERIKELEEKVREVEEANSTLIRAVNTAYRCSIAKNLKDCPVLATLKKPIYGIEDCKIK